MSDFLDRARAAAGDDGRLALGGMPQWEVFPFEADLLRVRPLDEYADPEPDRRKDPADCKVCQALGRPELVLHEGDHLTVIRTGGTSLVFTANVVSRAHAPLDDLADDGLAELGLLVGRTYRALRALPEVGNVHVNKWENGAGHLAVVLLARPRGVLQLQGSNLPIWADMLPPVPEEEYAERAGRVRRALA
ncbi:MAG: hypothetical protein WKF50_13420 [Nocardioides sp.]